MIIHFVERQRSTLKGPVPERIGLFCFSKRPNDQTSLVAMIWLRRFFSARFVWALADLVALMGLSTSTALALRFMT